MRISLLGPSLLAISLSLTACQAESSTSANQSDPPAAGAARQAVWSDETAGQLRDAVAARAAHGLDQMRFDDGGGSASDRDRLTKAALAYAGALARGASDPTKLYEVYTVPRPELDLRAGLARALAGDDVRGWLESLAPQDANYKKLSEAYLALRKQPDAAPSIPAPAEPLKPGATDPRVPAIARQLVALDYLDPAQAQGNRYTPLMAAAMKRLQADYGIKPDGVIGEDAVGVLTLSDADRARAIAVNMERLRWLERDPAKTRIDVNLAAARLAYWRDGQLADGRKVVVGEPENETPQLGSPIFRLVANPTWTVPKSIATEEIAPKGAGYLRANNMAWKDGWIVQQPGPKNSLGLVKFDMKNDHAIYLHDTPAKPLFNEVQRQRSHGCVRVDDALGFAAMLAADQGVADRWMEARATGKETFVPLPREIPVRMLYQTVLFDEDGEAIVRNDPYGWNDRVADALGFPAQSGIRVQTRHADVGP